MPLKLYIQLFFLTFLRLSVHWYCTFHCLYKWSKICTLHIKYLWIQEISLKMNFLVSTMLIQTELLSFHVNQLLHFSAWLGAFSLLSDSMKNIFCNDFSAKFSVLISYHEGYTYHSFYSPRRTERRAHMSLEFPNHAPYNLGIRTNNFRNVSSTEACK